jgi:hypothetical protein
MGLHVNKTAPVLFWSGYSTLVLQQLTSQANGIYKRFWFLASSPLSKGMPAKHFAQEGFVPCWVQNRRFEKGYYNLEYSCVVLVLLLKKCLTFSWRAVQSYACTFAWRVGSSCSKTRWELNFNFQDIEEMVLLILFGSWLWPSGEIRCGSFNKEFLVIAQFA